MFVSVLCLCDVCRGLFLVWSCLFLFCVFVMYVGVFSWFGHVFFLFCVFVMYVGVFSWSGHVLFHFVSL